MKIWLMRHGIAEELGGPGGPRRDEDRRLTPRGKARTEEVARGLRALQLGTVVLMTSPLVRAVETAAIVARVCDIKEPPVTTWALAPEAPPPELWAEISRGGERDVFCVGHLPHVGLAVADALRARPASLGEFRKAGVAILEFPRLPPKDAVLVAYLPPRVLRAVGRGRVPD